MMQFENKKTEAGIKHKPRSLIEKSNNVQNKKIKSYNPFSYSFKNLKFKRCIIVKYLEINLFLDFQKAVNYLTNKNDQIKLYELETKINQLSDNCTELKDLKINFKKDDLLEITKETYFTQL